MLWNGRIWVGAALALVGFAATTKADELCRLDPASAPDKPAYVEATVEGPAGDEVIIAQTRIAILHTHAPMSPAYVKLPRILAAYRQGGVLHHIIAAIVDGPIPVKGESVTLASRHRDPDQPCAFIPWTVVKAGTAI